MANFLQIFVAEIIGTALLILLGNGAVANVLLSKSKGHNGGWIVIATGWGLAVALAVYVCGWISDAHINPAVTLSFAIIGKTPWNIVPWYLLGQFIGAFIGANLVFAAYYHHYQKEGNDDLIRMSFCTQPAIFAPLWNFLTEAIATFVLVFSVLGVSNQATEISTGFIPYMIGIIVFSIGLSLGGPTGYAINPARDLAPRLAHSFLFSFKKSQWHYAWVPLFGPLVGGILGALCYQWLF